MGQELRRRRRRGREKSRKVAAISNIHWLKMQRGLSISFKSCH
jgi:hypothetical protein